MPRRCDPDILGKVLPYRLFARLCQTKQLLSILEPMIDSPHVEGNMFTEMAHDDLEVGMTVKDAVSHHAQYVKTDALCEAERWSDEPFAVCPELVVDCAGGVARVQVEGYVELGACLPEDVPVCVVVKDHVISIGASPLGVVHEGAFEAEGLDAAAEFGSCFLGVVHGESSGV